MFQLSLYLIGLPEPVSLSLKFCSACFLLSLCIWSLVSAVLDVVARAMQMHQIPCTKCRFFTTDYRLKCTVQPDLANTEQAINCSDYQPN